MPKLDCCLLWGAVSNNSAPLSKLIAAADALYGRATRHRRVVNAVLLAAELTLLLAVGLAFAAPVATLDPALRPPGLEHERLSGVIIPAQLGLRQYGRIPLWNPYLFTGEPLISNPFNYLFNPFASLPALVFGAVQGTKIAIVLAVLIAGLSAWALARAVGLGALARLAAAILYMCNGQIAGKFNMGHFQLAVSLAWPPLILAGLWWTLTTDRRWPKALAAFAFAMLFFSGNIYYALHTLFSAAVMTLFFVVRLSPTSETRGLSPLSKVFGIRAQGWRRLDLDRARLRGVVIAGVFAFGLCAVQFLPVWAARAYISHPGDPALSSSTSVEVALAGYLQPHPEWVKLKKDGVLFEGVEYAYVGPLALAALGLPILYLRRRDPDLNWRAPVLSLILFLLMFSWATGTSPLFNWLYAQSSLLAQFRYVGRAHAFGALWLAVMVGLVVDTAWRLAWRAPMQGNMSGSQERAESAESPPGSGLEPAVSPRFIVEPAGLIARLALTALLALILFAGLGEEHRANSKLLTPIPTNPLEVRNAYNALKARSLTVEYFYLSGLDAYDAYYAQIKNWSLIEGWWPLGLPSEVGPQSALNLLPRYALVLEGERTGLRYVHNEGYKFLGGYQARHLKVEMYELPDSLPYAFVATRANLGTLRARDRLTASHVEPAAVVVHEIDRITVRAWGEWPGEDLLVVMETNFPGWHVAVDGVPRPVVAVGNYLGVETAFGEHTYTFWFHPIEFDIGLIVSMTTLLVIIAYLGVRKRGRSRPGAEAPGLQACAQPASVRGCSPTSVERGRVK